MSQKNIANLVSLKLFFGRFFCFNYATGNFFTSPFWYIYPFIIIIINPACPAQPWLTFNAPQSFLPAFAIPAHFSQDVGCSGTACAVLAANTPKA